MSPYKVWIINRFGFHLITVILVMIGYYKFTNN